MKTISALSLFLALLLAPAACSASSGTTKSPAPILPVETDGVDHLIARGRAELEAGRASDAERIFAEAAEKDGGSLRTRMWVIRSWMDQGRINDSLNAIDALDKTLGKESGRRVEIDYLYGMAFAAKARDYIRSNVGGSAIQMSLDDAVLYLDRATKTDPELARDAYLPLAEAAWYGQKLDVARPAAEKAALTRERSPDAHFMLGRIALSQFTAAKDEPARKAEADAHWETARTALARAAELLGRPDDPERADTLARVRVDLGHTYVWKEKVDLAQLEYAEAMSLRPDLVQFPQVRTLLGGERFLAAVESARTAIASRPLAEAPDIATVDWWLGWARYEQKQYDKADEAFSTAVAKWPGYVNAWFFIALSRYHRQDFEGAVAALRRHWDEDPSDLVFAIGASPETNLRIVDFLVSWLTGKQRNEEAALLSEMQAAVEPSSTRFWNNAGLFWRDAGEALTKTDRPGAREEATECFEKSWKAYSEALEREPENPAYLNDAAVILHYYLDRDLGRAKAMYEKAAERARIELERRDLAPDVRELYQTALRDSQDNLEKLARGDKRF